MAQLTELRHNSQIMPKQIPQAELDAIQAAVAHFPEGAALEEVSSMLADKMPRRTLQRRLALLVEQKQLTLQGRGRGSRYQRSVVTGEGYVVADNAGMEGTGEIYVPVSPEGQLIKKAVREPIQNRRPVGYNQAFLDEYQPNETFYLTADIRQHLFRLGCSNDAQRPAGTYIRQILSRLLIIDLSWNSSRLEGNTYSLLETERLLELGETAEGKNAQDAQMIVNNHRLKPVASGYG